MPHTHARPSHNGRVQRPAVAAPRRKSVLIYEDYASVGGLIAALVRQEGYRAIRAWDVPEAVRLVRGRAPDLILLDLNLTYPTGIEPLHQIAAQGNARHIPVVIIAANPIDTTTDAGLVREVVQKPFDIDVMLNAVRGALGDPLVEVQPHHFDAQDHFLNGY